MRKPNGYGSIKKLSGRRRRPFVFVMSKDGKQRPIEYFETQVQAEIFQADFNRIHNNRSLPNHKITFIELYHRWLPAHISATEPSKSTISGYTNAYRHCCNLYYLQFSSIKYQDYQFIIDGMRKSGLSYSSCKKVRSLISLLSNYASKIEESNKNYAPLLILGKNKSVRPHHPFSRQKINRLWSHTDVYGVDTVLILLYTGMRCSELLNLSKSDISIRHQYLNITKSKTKSGIRVIPLHDRIFPLIRYRMSLHGPNLICDDAGNPYNYGRYRIIWNNIMTIIHADGHTTHDCRHTVATLLDNAGANENAKRRILGHATGDVTDRVYTHKGLRQLRKAIMLLK